jgi:DnaJ homolog subfamily C member 13
MRYLISFGIIKYESTIKFESINFRNLFSNVQTREELRSTLETELRTFDSDRELGGSNLIAWNHTEIEIVYRSLQDEVKIGDYYLRLLLEAEDSPDSPIRKS